jgi:hypothetical protein
MLLSLVSIGFCLEAGTNTAENHPKLNWKNGGSSVSGSVTVDANWRWTHIKGDTKNCYDGNLWSDKYCPDAATCGKNCVLEGADYQGTYGVSASGDALTLTFVTHGQYSTNVGSRLYLLKDEKTTQVFNLIGKEFIFTFDVSNLPCGPNGALYFVQMDGDGGTSRYPDNNTLTGLFLFPVEKGILDRVDLVPRKIIERLPLHFPSKSGPLSSQILIVSPQNFICHFPSKSGPLSSQMLIVSPQNFRSSQNFSSHFSLRPIHSSPLSLFWISAELPSFFTLGLF